MGWGKKAFGLSCTVRRASTTMFRTEYLKIKNNYLLPAWLLLWLTNGPLQGKTTLHIVWYPDGTKKRACHVTRPHPSFPHPPPCTLFIVDSPFFPPIRNSTEKGLLFVSNLVAGDRTEDIPLAALLGVIDRWCSWRHEVSGVKGIFWNRVLFDHAESWLATVGLYR